MKINSYLDKLNNTENNLDNSFVIEKIDTNKVGPFNKLSIWGKRTEKEELLYRKWEEKIGLSLDITPFRDVYFLRNFLQDIDSNLWFNYVLNTCLFSYNKECDYNYVLVTRRSIPTYFDKPEEYWTTEYINSMNGLFLEIPEGPYRLHTVILVTTLNNLIKYGIILNNNGITDGEIKINSNNFDRNDILFIVKNQIELNNLIIYLNNGGLTNKEIFKYIKDSKEGRSK